MTQITNNNRQNICQKIGRTDRHYSICTIVRLTDKQKNKKPIFVFYYIAVKLLLYNKNTILNIDFLNLICIEFLNLICIDFFNLICKHKNILKNGK